MKWRFKVRQEEANRKSFFIKLKVLSFLISLKNRKLLISGFKFHLRNEHYIKVLNFTKLFEKKD